MQTRKSPISVPASALLPEKQRRKRFRQQDRLKKRVEITRVFKKGKAVSCFGVKLFFLANNLPDNRIVITFARKYGNAVQRNRARRLSREAYRLMKSTLAGGYDLVLLIYPNQPPRVETGGKAVRRPSFAHNAGRLKALFTRAGMYRQEAFIVN